MRTNGEVFEYGETNAVTRVEFHRPELTALEAEALARHQLQRNAIYAFHRTGILGEAAAMRALGLPLRFCHERDNGSDFLIGNLGIDVKCSTNAPRRSNLLFDSFDHFRADLAMLTRVADEDEAHVAVEVIGWVTRADFRERAHMASIRGVSKPLCQRQSLRPIASFWRDMPALFITGGTDHAITSASNQSGSVHGLSAV